MYAYAYDILIEKIVFHLAENRGDDGDEITDLADVDDDTCVMTIHHTDEDGTRYFDINKPRTVFDGVLPKVGYTLSYRAKEENRSITIKSNTGTVVYEKYIDRSELFPPTKKERLERESLRQGIQKVIDRMRENMVIGARGDIKYSTKELSEIPDV